MDFRGHLRLPDDAGIGIPVLLRLDDIFVVISSGGDELGAWRADDVSIERLYSNQFAIELDGEPMVFVAQDALGFAYEGIVAIEDLQERLTKRRVFKRSKRKKPDTDAAAPVPAETEVVGVDSEPPAGTAEPSFTIVPEPIWTPPPTASAPSAPAVSPVAPLTPVPDPEPVVPQRLVEPERSEPSPANVRVSYPRTEKPAPPSVESFVPPSAEPGAAPTNDAPAHAEQVAVDPVVVAEPVAIEAVVHAEPVAIEAVVHAEPVAVEPVVEAEPEYEIEEVTAAASGAEWFPDEVASPAADPEPEIEYDEYVLPAAGTMDTFDSSPHSEPERVDAPAEFESEDVEVPAAEAEVEFSPAEDNEPLPVAPQSLEAPQPTEQQPDQVIHANGHRAVQDLSEEAGARERRRSFFGRGRDKKVPPHDHVYGDPKTIGGLTRQVCDTCGHVTFSGEDVYQGW